MGLHGLFGEKELLGHLGVGVPLRHQGHHVDLPVGELAEHGGVLGHGGPGDVFGDEPAGHRGREQRFPSGDDADRGDHVLGGGVLEEESAGTGPQG